jgi:two-component system LytT family sensor kinase
VDVLNEPFPRVPARLVLASIVAVWLCYLVLTTARGVLVGLELHSELFWRRMLVTAASMAITALVWPILRLLDARRFWQQATVVLLVALPASLALAAINQWVFADIEEQVQAKIGEREGLRIRSDESGNLLVDPLNRPDAVPATTSVAPPSMPGTNPTVPTVAEQEQTPAITIGRAAIAANRWRQLTDLALSRYFILIAWAGLYFALVAAAQARAAERREGDYRRAAKAAELRSLRYQVNPHFLFNTLNSLSALVLTGKAAKAETMIQTLSTFYRRSLADEPSADVALAEEIELQQLYLEIEATRFPERLRTRFDVPEHLADARVPGMILQPLVENSVKYAVAPTRRRVTIGIEAREEYGRLVLTVSDDGPGPAGKRTDGRERSTGIGLANVRERLAARFGDAASVASEPGAGGGWRTVIRLPLVDHD